MNLSELNRVLFIMKTLSAIIILFLTVACSPIIAGLSGLTQHNPLSDDASEQSQFEKAVEIIKKYETLHKPKHWPFVGYGHKVLPGEKFSRKKSLSESEADALLRKDLLKNCAIFRSFGADSLLLGVLAYNIGSGAAKRSSVAKKLAEGYRDIRDNYLAHSKYRGKTHKQIQQRRIEEFDALFIQNPQVGKIKSSNIFSTNSNVISLFNINQFNPNYTYTSQLCSIR